MNSGGHIYLGAAIDPSSLGTAAYANALKQNGFDSLTAENAMKFGNMEPTQGQFNFGPADQIVAFAQTNKMRVRDHTMVWYNAGDIPAWVNGLSNADAEAALKTHIQTIMARYKGKVQQWDVVNEALDDGTGALRSSVWLTKLGPDYVAKAFQWAREADPTAQLSYNDYGVESRDLDGDGSNKRFMKADAMYAMVKDFKARGVPIDVVGFQAHSYGQYPGTGPEIQSNIERFGALGVKVEITELDAEGDATTQANRYAAVGRACHDSTFCTGVTTWGLYDGATWRPNDNPLLLDASFKPKPAYTALIKAIGQ